MVHVSDGGMRALKVQVIQPLWNKGPILGISFLQGIEREESITSNMSLAKRDSLVFNT